MPMAYAPKHCIGTGRLVADEGKQDWDELVEHGAQLMEDLDSN
jgi:hypothetical protein